VHFILVRDLGDGGSSHLSAFCITPLPQPRMGCAGSSVMIAFRSHQAYSIGSSSPLGSELHARKIVSAHRTLVARLSSVFWCVIEHTRCGDGLAIRLRKDGVRLAGRMSCPCAKPIGSAQSATTISGLKWRPTR